jgi:fumarylacetoacetate (FAA) hydrolase family protein
MAGPLPADWRDGAFALRIEGPEGPCAVALLNGAAFDMTPVFGTVSAWLNEPDPVAAIRRGVPLPFDAANALWLAPVDLQAIKAAGVTYVRSMLERVIEERCRGDASRAASVREEVRAILGRDLAAIIPGSAEAARVKAALVEKGWWSQYLEVGIGPDAEIFTKAQPMSAVGHGAKVGVHPASAWSNPEPEAVLALNARGEIIGCALGNDVNLRDIEGRSALLLGRAKDNNAACAIGPAIRLFDEGFTLGNMSTMRVTLTIEGGDGFVLREEGEIGTISRSPAELAAQLWNAHHQYPDGAVLFCGTPFSPSADRGEPGTGFTHRAGDVVTISTPRLGTLRNVVDRTDACPPWRFGTGALMANLARRGLPRA